MKSRAYGLLVAFGMCCAVHIHLAAQQHSLQPEYTIKHFTPENGLGTVQTRGIVQDKHGFIWAGSRELVSRFDGYNFKVYQFDPKNLLKSSYTGGILSLHTDREKNLWIKSELFSKYDPKIDSFMHYKPNLQLSVVTRICFENDSRIVWFGTFNSGLYSFDTESGETNHFINKSIDSLGNVLSNSIRGISDRDSFLLVATLKGLWKFDKERKIFNRPKCNPKDSTILYQKNIWEIFDSQNEDEIWIFPSGGLIRLDQNFTITQSFNFPRTFNSVMHTRDGQGVFWLGTKNGIFRYDPVDGSSGYLEGGAEIARLANNIFIDREQNLWLGTESYGLFQFSPSKIRFNHFNFDTPGAFITGSLYQVNGTDHLVLIRGDGHTNEMWTANLPILSSAIDSVRFQKLDINPPLQGLIMDTFVGKNKLWVCSWQKGITAFAVNTQTGIIETNKQERFISDEKKQMRSGL